MRARPLRSRSVLSPKHPPATAPKIQLKKPEGMASQSPQLQATMTGKVARTRPKKVAKLKRSKDVNEPLTNKADALAGTSRIGKSLLYCGYFDLGVRGHA